MVPTAGMMGIASQLQAWRGLDLFGATEVLTWWRGKVPAFAFRGPDLRIEQRLFRSDGMMLNRHHALDQSMQRALGLDARVERSQWGVGITGGAGQTLSDPDAHYSEVADAIAGIAAEQLGVEAVHVTVMPSGGAPWNRGEASTPFYNARTERMLEGRAPKGLVEVEIDNEKHVGVDPCFYAPKVTAASGAIVGRFASSFTALRGRKYRPAMDLIATHCLSLDRASIMNAAPAMRACGGMLFPSLAVGEIPATPFGPLCLVLRFSVVLEGLKPYRKGRGAWPIVVYKSDAWTGGVSSFRQGGAIVLFEQLTGAWEPSPYRNDHGVTSAHPWTLGPSISESGFMATEVDLVSNTAQLASSMFARAKLWDREITPERMAALSDQPKDRYPYLEAKSAAVVALESAPLALCPVSYADAARSFLATAGWSGELVTVATPPEWGRALQGEWDDNKAIVQWHYAWLLRDVILAQATARGLVQELLEAR
jgi:hypothetical protein